MEGQGREGVFSEMAVDFERFPGDLAGRLAGRMLRTDRGLVGEGRLFFLHTR